MPSNTITLKLTAHARERMKEQRITFDKVRRAVEAPHLLQSQADNIFKAVRRAKKKDLVVVYTVRPRKPRGMHVVITAYQHRAEQLEIHHRGQTLQRVARRRQRRKPFINVKKPALHHHCLHQPVETSESTQQGNIERFLEASNCFLLALIIFQIKTDLIMLPINDKPRLHVSCPLPVTGTCI